MKFIIFILSFVIKWQSKTIVYGAESGAWYVGCGVPASNWPGDILPLNVTEDEVNPTHCSKICASEKYNFVGVQIKNCFCLQEVQDILQDDEQLCNQSCTQSVNYQLLFLPCGSENNSAIYRSHGPYLYNATMAVDRVEGYTYHPVALEVLVQFAASPKMQLGLSTESEHIPIDGSTVTFDWSIISATTNHSAATESISPEVQQKRENDTLIYNTLSHMFTVAGNYSMRVLISNGISQLSLKVEFIITEPIPSGLQINIISPTKQKLPNCIPSDQTNMTSGTGEKLVFTGLDYQLEAVVTMGTHLTFDWWFSDDNSTFRIGPSSYVKGGCYNNLCSISVLNHTFEEIGEYEIYVKGHNLLGETEGRLQIVVVHTNIEDVTFKLDVSFNHITPPNQTVRFLVTLETAYREGTYLELYFGQDIVTNYSLSRNHDGIGLRIQNHPHEGKIFIPGSDGEHCELSFAVDHLFNKEGVYPVTLNIFNDRSINVQRKLHEDIVVQHKLKGVSVVSDKYVHLGSLVCYQGTFLQGSHQPILYHWKILNSKHKTIVDTSMQISNPKFNYTFTETGMYEVQLRAVNNISDISTTTLTHVEQKIVGGELYVVSNGSHTTVHHYIVGNEVTMVASVQEGSNLQFNWNPFGRDLIPGNPRIQTLGRRSTAVFTFTEIREYNISVEISNNLSTVFCSLQHKLNIQQPITGLNISSDKVVAMNDITTLVLTVEEGSHVLFDIDYGDRLERVNEIVQGKTVNTTHHFHKVGTFSVVVHASNQVSQKTKKIEIIVQEKVLDVVLELVSAVVVVEEYSTFIVKTKENDLMSNLASVVYEWFINDTLMNHSRTPLFNHKFLNTTGEHNITVRVYNQVSSNSAVLLLNVSASSNVTRFNVQIFYASGTKARFKIVHLPPLPVEIHLNYGGRRTNAQTVNVFQQLQTSEKDHSWQDVCMPEGAQDIYKVSANCVSTDQPEKTEYIETYLCCQDTIKGLLIDGPLLVQVPSKPVLHKWTAEMNSGTHMLYRWTLDGQTSGITAQHQFSTTLYNAGTLSLQLEAFNSLSFQTTSVEISVIHPVSNVIIVTRPVILGNKTEFEISVKGGREFDFEINFGDGSPVINKSSRESSDTGNPGVTKQSSSSEEIITYNMTIQHTYEHVGTFTVWLNVTNGVSSMEHTTTATVEEPIGNVWIQYTDSKRVLEVDQEILIVGNVEGGKNLRFVWEFGGDVESHEFMVKESPSTSNATVSFLEPGHYTVKLMVSHSLYEHPVVCQQPIEFTVEEKITGLEFFETNGKIAAALYQDTENGGFSTPEIHFTARVESGSNVKFRFDFGDGKHKVVNESIVLESDPFGGEYPVIHGYASHVFKGANKYRLEVMAYNDLNEETVDFPQGGYFYVQKEIRGLSLGQASFTNKVDHGIKFQAQIQQGTEVQFDWIMGDQTEYLNDVAVIHHTYTTAGKYNLQVRAHNKVNNNTFKAVVNIIKLIQGVRIEVDASQHEWKTKVEMRAVLTPDENIATLYRWNFGGTDTVYKGGTSTQECKGSLETEVCQFKREGKYAVTVFVSNDLSNATSDPVEIHVVERITGFRLEKSGESMLNQTVQFGAYSYSGSDITYYWSIVDIEDASNSLTKNITNMQFGHVFQRMGVYNVSVVAVNPLGNESARVRVHILDKICKPPELEILQLGGNTRDRIVPYNRSEDIKVEVKVKINCTISKSTDYTWIVKDSHGDVMPLGDNPIFNDRILYIPSRSLSYGNYTVDLEKCTFMVVESPLRSVVAGGIQRSVSRHETLIMDGSLSYDPDYPNDKTGLIYKWTCHVLGNRSGSCFQQAELVMDDTATVSIPASLFTDGTREFVFNLTVYKDGRQEVVSDQVIKVEEQELLDVELKCTACEENDGVINSNQRLILEAFHTGYNEHQLIYEWQLYKLSVGSTWDLNADPMPCISPDTLFQKIVHGDSGDAGVAERSTTSGDVPLTPDQQPIILTTRTASLTAKTTTATTVPPTTSTTDDYGDVQPETFFSFGEGDAEYEGDQEEEGCSNPFGCAGIGEGEVPGGRPDPGGNVGPDDGDGGFPGDEKEDDPAVDTELPRPEQPHVLSRTRISVQLRTGDTDTGLGHRILVIKDGYLAQNMSYIISVKVIHKDKLLEGEALMYFTVNTSPREGQCSLSPDSGIEMETKFTVYCNNWNDVDRPLTYEVQYSLDDEKPKDLVYQGLDHEIEFQLPAGLSEETQYNVAVHVYISDSLGARTSVCKTIVTVKPKTFDLTNKTEVQILYELVQEHNSSLSDYIQEGDNRNARIHAQIVANRLNRLHTSDETGIDGGGASEDETREIRQKIRRAMLWHLKDMPLRDEYEIQQTTAAVATATSKTRELNEDSLSFASNILQKASVKTNNMVHSGKHIDTQLTSLTIEGASNVLESVAKQSKVISRRGAKNIVVISTEVISKILHADTSQLVIGDQAIDKTFKNIHIIGNRHKLDEAIPTLTTNEVNFNVPTNLGEIIQRKVAQRTGGQARNVKDVDGGCFETHIVTYQYNPYLYVKGEEVETKVASLSLLMCDGEEVELTNLESDEVFHIEIPHDITEKDKKLVEQVFTLEKQQINYHSFNFTDDRLRSEALKINLEIVPVHEGRVFPIAVLIRSELQPTPTEYDHIYEFPLGQNDIQITLPPNTLSASAVYHIGISDAKFNAGKPRQGEVQTRQYRFRLWYGNCVFWDMSTERWSREGCHMNEGSSFDKAHCSCNHLTSFGAQFSLEPNDLNFKNIDDFFDLKNNPVTFSVVTAILVVYIALLILSIRADNHDKDKGAVIFLIDNNSRDKQKYILTFETGFRKNAGTSAKVSVVLHGDNGMSETRELVSQTGQSLFERNSRDTFILTLPSSLGQLYKIQLWHNNDGPNPGWFLSRATVKDVNTGMTYYFNCERWFAVDQDDGKVEKEISALDTGLGFSQVLWAKGTQYFADYHLWFSALTRPACSRFTRAQRLTCSLSLLMSYMAVNAMWYRQTEEQFRGEFGMIDVSWRAVVVGIVTSLMVLPPNALIVLIFRRSKAKNPGIIDEPDERKKALRMNAAESRSSINSTSQLLQPTHTTSIFDQSILKMQNLQEWAQRTWAKRYRHSPSGSTQSVHPPIQTLRMVAPQMVKPEQPANLTTNRNRPTDNIHETVDPISIALAMKLHGCNGMHSSSNNTSITTDIGSDTDLYSSMRSRKSSRCFVPWCFRFVAWALCVLIISGCAAVTVMYGFRFGRVKSIMWLQSLFFSFIQCVFVTHPIIIILLTLYMAVKYRNSMNLFDHHDDGILYDYAAEERSFSCGIATLKNKHISQNLDLAEGIAARQRSRYLRFARPPHEKSLLRSRNQTIKENKASSVFNESMSLLVIFLLLSVMAFGKDTTTSHRLSHTITQLVSGSSNGAGRISLQAIDNVAEFWQWLDRHFLGSVYHSVSSAGGYVDELRVDNSHVIGQVHIRQHRIIEQRCFLPQQYDLTPYCRYAYTEEKNRDSQPFGGGNATWVYFTEDYTGSDGITGRHGAYGGDGYLVMLNSNQSEARRQVAEMERENWIDKLTKAVVIEFTLFHPQSNIFSSVTVLLEMPTVGQVFPHIRVTSADLYKYYTQFDNFILACELLFMIVAMLKLRRVVINVMTHKRDFVRSMWNGLDVIFTAVALGFCGCFIYRFAAVGKTVEILRSTYKEDFVDVSTVAFWDQMLRTLVGLMYFVTILQILKILRHRQPFATVGNVLKHAALDILVVFFMFVIWIAAYTCLGLAMFGTLSYQFHSLDSAILSTSGLFTQHYPFMHLEQEGSQWSILGWKLFLVSFLICALGSMMAYTMAVLNFHYKVYKEDPKLVLGIGDTVSYYVNQFLQYFGLKRYEFPSEEEKLPTECTIAELNYQVDEMLFKINALAGTANLPEKPHIQTVFTDSDTTYGSGGGGGMGILADLDELYCQQHPDADFDLWDPMNAEKLNTRIQKIEENLLHQEPHLAQLLKLDDIGIGVDMLAREREKQLRNQLELEIFRQLQMARHSLDLSITGGGGGIYSAYPSSLSDQVPPSSGSASQSQNSEGSSGNHDSGNQDSGNMSPSGKRHAQHQFPATTTKPRNNNNDNSPKSNSKNQMKPVEDRNLYPTINITEHPKTNQEPHEQDYNASSTSKELKATKSRESTPYKTFKLPAASNQVGPLPAAEGEDGIPQIQLSGHCADDSAGISAQKKSISLQNSGSSDGVGGGSSSSGGREVQSLFTADAPHSNRGHQQQHSPDTNRGNSTSNRQQLEGDTHNANDIIEDVHKTLNKKKLPGALTKPDKQQQHKHYYNNNQQQQNSKNSHKRSTDNDENNDHKAIPHSSSSNDKETSGATSASNRPFSYENSVYNDDTTDSDDVEKPAAAAMMKTRKSSHHHHNHHHHRRDNSREQPQARMLRKTRSKGKGKGGTHRVTDLSPLRVFMGGEYNSRSEGAVPEELPLPEGCTNKGYVVEGEQGKRAGGGAKSKGVRKGH